MKAPHAPVVPLAILLLLLGAKTCLAGEPVRPRVEIIDAQVVICGSIVGGQFQGAFKLRADGAGVEALTFTPGNLREVVEGKLWLTPANIQITPDANTIGAGQTQEFVVNIQNVPKAGQYDGVIAIRYKGQAADAHDLISLSVRAVKFTPIPPKLLIKLEKCLFCGGGDDPHLRVSVVEEGGGVRLPDELKNKFVSNLSVILAPLTNSEDESQVLYPVLSPPLTGGNGVTGSTQDLRAVLDRTFKHPQVGAGRYVGSLQVRSEGMGLVAAVPVEVRVRYSSYLAWLTILSGILISLLLRWWNTTGKKKNSLQSRAYELSNEIEAAKITESCRRELREILSGLRPVLARDDIDNADKTLVDVRNKLAGCVSEKEVLLKKAAEVRAMLGESGAVEGRLKQVFLPSHPVLAEYWPRVRASLEALESNIREEAYAAGDALEQAIDAERKRLDEFSGQVLDGLDELAARADGIVRDYRGAFGQEADALEGGLNRGYVEVAKSHVAGIRAERDRSQVVAEIREDVDDLRTAERVVRSLINYDRIIKELKGKGVDTREAEGELGGCKVLLNSASISLADEARAKVEGAIKLAFERFSSSASNTREVKNVERVMQVSIADAAPPPDGRGRDVGRRGADASAAVTPGARSARLTSSLSKLRVSLTPARKERMVNVTLWLIFIPLLAVVGYTQLYEVNPTFGSKSPWQEYVTLFLWGFSIQTGTATVSEVLKTVRGT